jgi:pyruvate kinase
MATRRTKIVATLGPASDRPGVLDGLVAAGVDVFRLNLSHGHRDEHLARLQAVRASAAERDRHVAVLADLPGPKVRTGAFPDGGTFLADGSELRLVPGEDPSGPDTASVDYPPLIDDLRPGDSVVLGDGAITLVVSSVEPGAAVVTRVLTGGLVQGRPGVHLPSERLQLSAPTAHDLELVDWIVTDAVDVDFVAVSFVRGAADVTRVKVALGPHGARVVAKIETPPAITELDDILAAADAVMVARGDLGIECPLEDVPHLQKRIIRACVEAGVPVITATQMLESMITSPAPTRAEVSDVANAVFDGTDALMLSGETAIGHDPVRVVRTMARIAARAEAEASYKQWARRLGEVQRRSWSDGPTRITQAVAHAAWHAASDCLVAAIVCCTYTGRTARGMARFRPEAALFGLSPDVHTARAMALSWGVLPMKVDAYRSTDEMVWFAVETVERAGYVHKDDLLAVLAGAPDLSGGGATDVLRIVRVG